MFSLVVKNHAPIFIYAANLFLYIPLPIQIWYIYNMDLPDLDPQKQFMFTTYQLIRALRTSPNTFYKYLKQSGIEYHKRRNCNAKYYNYEEALILSNLIYPPKKVFSLLYKRKDKD